MERPTGDLKMKRSAFTKSGFTLIEVTISLFVFSMLVLVFAGSVVMAKKSTSMNGQCAQALSLCQHKIDQMRAVGYGRLTYAELSDAGIIDAAPDSSPYSFLVVDDVARYLPQPTAQVAIQAISTNVVKVTATVTWRIAAHESKTSTVSLCALIANTE